MEAPARTKPTLARKVELIQRLRAGAMLFEAILFAAWQIWFLTRVQAPDVSPGLTEHQALGLITIVWVGVCLLMLGTTGVGLRRDSAIRSLLEDETTILHRGMALSAGFWAAMAAVVTITLYAEFRPVDVFHALHVILGFGVATPLARFGWLEWRAQADA